jgi:DNA (cytosine-5)-methyltransferase 1
MNALTVGSLFSGIGGLDLGLERAGMRVIWQSEIDSYACRVLKKHWPEVPNYGDIKKIDWANVEPPDVICGGYPCQPFSQAGKRRGEEDPRHLWPWVRESIRILRPRYAILENVQGHLSIGGTTVIREIAELGYDCEWRIIPASSVGAHHRRNRIIIVAYPNDTGSYSEKVNPTETGFHALGGIGGRRENVADANDSRLQGRTETPLSGREVTDGHSGTGGSDMADTRREWGIRRRGPFEGLNAEIRGHAIRSAAYWDVEPRVDRVAHGVPSRVDRLKGLGNAVVPQVAEIVGRLVVEHSTQ